MRDRSNRAAVAWGDQLRAARHMHRRLFRRGLAIAALFGGLAVTIALPPRPLLVWNASPSAPVGLYAVTETTDLAVGDMVIAHVPAPWRQFGAVRHYIPANVPLVKRVAAAPGDQVCALDEAIFVNGKPVARRRIADGQGRPMPWWDGCVMLRDGALFLLTESPASFDGRYFGPTARDEIVGRARPLWLR